MGNRPSTAAVLALMCDPLYPSPLSPGCRQGFLVTMTLWAGGGKDGGEGKAAPAEVTLSMEGEHNEGEGEGNALG